MIDEGPGLARALLDPKKEPSMFTASSFSAQVAAAVAAFLFSAATLAFATASFGLGA